MIKADFSKVAVFSLPELNRAACEGYSARRGGVAMTGNPYPLNSVRAGAWEDAWIIADAELNNAPPAPFAPGTIEHHVRRRWSLKRLAYIVVPPFAFAAALAGVVGIFVALLRPQTSELFVGITAVLAAGGGWLLTIDWGDD